jgi:hypothetical protein
MTTNDNKRIEVSGAWSALSPALSPGERGRVRADVPIYFGIRHSAFEFYN